MHRMFIVRIDTDTIDLQKLKKMNILYELELIFATDDHIPETNRNILHLSKEGRQGVQSYELREKNSTDIVDDLISKIQERSTQEYFTRCS